MEIVLTPELASFVQHEVETGIFGDPSQVVHLALQRLKDERERDAMERSAAEERLIKRLTESMERYERGEFIPAEKFFADFEKRHGIGANGKPGV